MFAKKALTQGQQFPVTGVFVRRDSVADHCTRFADAYKFRVGAGFLIPLGYEGIINHSRMPNLQKVMKGNKLFLRTLRTIKAGEELFFRYSRYAERRFHCD